MSLSLVLVQLLLAVLLFFIVNWIGRHSISSGYLQLSLFAKADEAPAFNFLFRTLAPVVYILIVASVFYYLGLDQLVTNFYLVAVYYVLVRWAFNIVTERGRLLNWPGQLIVAAAIVTLAYGADRLLISTRQTLLPDFTTIANELWIVVLLFLYQVANKITLSSEASIRRKQRYLQARLEHFSRRFGPIIDSEAAGSGAVRDLAYAVLIYETFNRPTVYRWIESRILFPLHLSKTLGPMQVHTDVRIGDDEAVSLGVRKLLAD